MMLVMIIVRCLLLVLLLMIDNDVGAIHDYHDYKAVIMAIMLAN